MATLVDRCPLCSRLVEVSTKRKRTVTRHTRAIGDPAMCPASGQPWAYAVGMAGGAPPEPPAPAVVDDADPVDTCGGKRIHASESAADEWAFRTTRRNVRRPHSWKGIACRSYPCPRCQGWHVTSTPIERRPKE